MKLMSLLAVLFVCYSCSENRIKEVDSNKDDQKVLPIPIDTTKVTVEYTPPKAKTSCDDPEIFYESKEDVNFEKHPVILIKNNCPTQTIITVRYLLHFDNNGFKDSLVKIFKNLNLKPGENVYHPIENSMENVSVEMMDYYTSDGEHHSTYNYQLKDMIRLQKELDKQYPDNGKFNSTYNKYN